MSSREKRLLTLFAIAGFAMLNILGFTIYQKKATALETSRLAAEQKIERANLYALSREKRLDEMNWLETHMPEPAEYQNVQTALEAACVSAAQGFRDLTIKRQGFLPTVQDKSKHFHRVRIELILNGSEKSLYNWISDVRVHEQLRNVTSLQLTPDSQDKTLITAKVIVEQWFVPVEPTL